MNKFFASAAEQPAFVQRAQDMKFGTAITRTGVRFRLWAPRVDAVSLLIEGQEPSPMQAQPRGWFELDVDGAGHGTRYSFALPDGTRVPDAASRFQPDDVHGVSEVIDPRRYQWRDIGWRGRPWEETVLYELHIGTFTQEGTFLAAIEKLDHLVSLGVTALQIMPVADFRGRWNWGYDGVLHFAPDSSYGRPEDFKALVDAAHQRSLMVFLDVVYNHFGPEGNYLSLYTPLLTDSHATPWGPAVNFDDEGSAMVRDFVLANGRYWLTEFHLDGLRFDAVHAIRDTGPKHLLLDLAEQLRSSTDGRHVHLVAENSDNQAEWLKRQADLRPTLYTAQWSDDIHHALHCAATGEAFWYYTDYAGRTDLLARALAEGFGYQGEYMRHEKHPKGQPSADLPATAFVSFIQNHDQVGNRPLGERLTRLAPRQALRSLAAIYLLSPHIPMLFMGEEWGSRQPFPFFSDMDEDLAERIRTGRAQELSHMPEHLHAEDAPDPMAEATFRAAKLVWDEVEDPEYAEWLSFYRALITLRHKEIVPRLAGIGGHCGFYDLLGPKAFRVWWTLGDGSTLTLVSNLSQDRLEHAEPIPGRILWAEGIAAAGGFEPFGTALSLSEQ